MATTASIPRVNIFLSFGSAFLEFLFLDLCLSSVECPFADPHQTRARYHDYVPNVSITFLRFMISAIVSSDGLAM